MRVSYIEDLQAWVDDFDFYVEVTVRFSETDMYGHMNNTVPFTYFEYARIELLKSLGIFGPANVNRDAIIVVADLQCDFLKQVYFDETLRIYTKVAKIGSSSFDIHYLAKNAQGEPCFTGRGTIVQMNPKTGKSIPFTEEEKLQLNGKILK